MIELQRVYEHRRTTGTHFFVERLWPRGIRKESLHFSDWLKDAAPSDSLRRWFQHDVSKWTEFQRRSTARTTANTTTPWCCATMWAKKSNELRMPLPGTVGAIEGVECNPGSGRGRSWGVAASG